MLEPYPHLHVVIIGADNTTQLWPLARRQRPRELVTVPGDDASLLARMVTAVLPLVKQPIHLMTSLQLAPVMRDHLIGSHIVDEKKLDIVALPVWHGTAFALAIAAARIKQSDPNAILLVLRAGIRFEPNEVWSAAIGRAYRAATEEYLSIVGIKPTVPTCSHGFIRRGEEMAGNIGVYHVIEYDEKPSSLVASRIPHPTTYWDTGISLMRANLVLGEFYRRPVEGVFESHGYERIAETATFLVALAKENWYGEDAREVIAALPKCSYEQVLFESSDKLMVVDSSLAWQDISSLVSLDEIAPLDSDHNRMIGRVRSVAASGNTVYAGSRLVTLLGLKNTVVVDTPDALLIATRENSKEPEEIASLLSKNNDKELMYGDVTWHSWGSETLLQAGEGFEVRRLDITAGARTPALSQSAAQGQLSVIGGKGTLSVEGKTRQISLGSNATIEPGSFYTLVAGKDSALALIEVSTLVESNQAVTSASPASSKDSMNAESCDSA